MRSDSRHLLAVSSGPFPRAGPRHLAAEPDYRSRFCVDILPLRVANFAGLPYI